MSQINSFSQLDLVDGVYSYADYLTWEFEERTEIIKGKVFLISTPNRKHQAISRELVGNLGTILKYFDGYAAPFDVRLYDKTKSKKANKDIYTVVQPDICIICDLEKLDDKGCLGSPDLIIEILSPGNSSKEMRLKKLLYEESGVREYLIFDPEHSNVFQFHLTEEDVYSPATIYIDEDTFQSVIFPDMSFDLKEIFEAN